MGYIVAAIIGICVLLYVLESLPRWLIRRGYGRNKGIRSLDDRIRNIEYERQRQMTTINAERRAAEEAMWRIAQERRRR